MCFNAKRPGWDTHFVRESPDPKSKVTCPFLLALECRYCKGAGHTKNYCPVLKAKMEREKAVASEEKQAETQRREAQQALGEFVNPTKSRRAPQAGHSPSPANGRPPTSRFGALAIESDSECSDTPTETEEYPALPSTGQAISTDELGEELPTLVWGRKPVWDTDE